MSGHRPKVISFPTTLDGLNIAAKQSILWPCHAFNISIPQKKKSLLNVFEETVLKITEIQSGNTENLALITCLEKELVAFIQNRLKQLGLLNDRYELSEHGQELLNEWQNKSDGNLEYTMATVFVDLLSKKLLPYVSMDQLCYKKIKNIYQKKNPKKKGQIEHYVNFFINPTNENSIRAIQMRPAKDSSKKIPDSHDIIRAIRGFKKKYKRHALLNQDVDQYPPLVPMAEAISVNTSPELVYLHCEALIQTGNSDLLVTDGCGFGFSESFANYLTSQELGWVTKLKKKGVVDKITDSEASDKLPAIKFYKYDEISKRIAKSKSALSKIRDLKVDNTYYESKHRQEIEKGIKNLYAALEWSLRKVVADNPAPEWEQVFSASSFRDNEKLLVGFAKKVGFSVNEKNQNLLQVKPGAIRQIKNGKAELQPLLALAIVGANSNANHQIHRLAQNHSGFLTHALRLKKYRDPIEHGSTEKLNVDKKILEELIDTTVPMLISLVPGVAGDLELVSDIAGYLKKVNQSSSDTDINQERLKANIKLEESLGMAFVSTLTGDTKEQLLRSELMLAKYTNEKAIEIIKCYSSVMQHALLDAVQDCKLNSESDKIRESAIEKIVQSGFYPAPNYIPKQISTVNIKRLYRAVQGSSTTLGAHLLAVFLLRSESELIQLKKATPSFMIFIAKLIQLRGHGNQQIDISQDHINSLKKNLFKAIKIIPEIF